jgi:hypothetical protein
MAGRYVKRGCRTGPAGWESMPWILKRLRITTIDFGRKSDRRSMQIPRWLSISGTVFRVFIRACLGVILLMLGDPSLLIKMISSLVLLTVGMIHLRSLDLSLTLGRLLLCSLILSTVCCKIVKYSWMLMVSRMPPLFIRHHQRYS